MGSSVIVNSSWEKVSRRCSLWEQKVITFFFFFFLFWNLKGNYNKVKGL
jgi:hypothetical protein